MRDEGRGTLPGDMRPRTNAGIIHQHRSTKAGGHTRRHFRPIHPRSRIAVAQCRSGGRPGDTCSTATAPEEVEDRSTKAGARNAGDTQLGEPGVVQLDDRSNEGRGTHPGDTRPSDHGRRAPRPLNEGRGTHPGDTARWQCGPTPRAHRSNEGRGTHPGDTDVAGRHRGRRLRSTKAGARTPATLAPGRHPTARGVDTAQTKAGARTPATPDRKPEAFDAAPAQRRPGHAPRRHLRPAQGRDRIGSRSTKAGARTPATPRHVPRRQGADDRSTKAGARTPATPTRKPTSKYKWNNAQRRPGHAPRRHAAPSPTRCAADRPLNEGRGTHPGDTW